MPLENRASLGNPTARSALVQAVVTRISSPHRGCRKLAPLRVPRPSSRRHTVIPILPEAYILGEFSGFAPRQVRSAQSSPGTRDHDSKGAPASRAQAVTKRLHPSGPSKSTLH